MTDITEKNINVVSNCIQPILLLKIQTNVSSIDSKYYQINISRNKAQKNAFYRLHNLNKTQPITDPLGNFQT